VKTIQYTEDTLHINHMDQKKEITTNELAELIKSISEASDKRIDAKIVALDKRTDAKIDALAEMVGRGFNEMGERMDIMENNITLLKQGQERIEMRLMNVAYRSELDAVTDRVQVLERQMKTVLKK
jgi:hypothetical protein